MKKFNEKTVLRVVFKDIEIRGDDLSYSISVEIDKTIPTELLPNMIGTILRSLGDYMYERKAKEDTPV